MSKTVENMLAISLTIFFLVLTAAILLLLAGYTPSGKISQDGQAAEFNEYGLNIINPNRPFFWTIDGVQYRSWPIPMDCKPYDTESMWKAHWLWEELCYNHPELFNENVERKSK